MKAAQNNDSNTKGGKGAVSVIIKIEADETTPLLEASNGRKSRLSNSRGVPRLYDIHLLSFAVLFIGGMTIASYLLMKEGRLPVISFSLDLVNRDVWSQIHVPLGRKLNDSHGLHVIMVQTGGESCTDLENCTDILRNMQKAQITDYEIPYNFLISGNGQAYEVRGWNYDSGLNFLTKQTSLVIGFIGNYTTASPSDIQCTSAISVIHEFVRRKKLHSSYQVFGMRNLSISHFDGEALFNRISKWRRFETILHVF